MSAPAAVSSGALAKTARNILSNWGGQLFGLVSAFFVSPYVVHRLGSSGYGVWSLMLAVTSYMALLDLGVRGAVLRYVSKHHTQQNDEEASRVASSAMAIFSTACVITVIATAVMAVLVGHLFNIPPELVPASRPVLLAAGLSVGLTLIGGVYTSTLSALQRFDLMNVIEVAISIGRTAGMVLALALGGGLVSMAAVLAIFAVLRFAWFRAASVRLYPTLRLSSSLVSRTHIGIIFGYGTYSFLINVGDRLIYFSDSVVIGAALPIASVAFFAIASNLIDTARTLAAGISQTLSPLASSLEAKSEHGGIRTLLLSATKLCSVVTYPALITLIIRGPSFITIWMGPDYGPSSGRIVQILTLSLLFTTAVHPAGGVLLGIDRHRPLAPLMLFEGIANIGLSIVLLRFMGLDGVAWGTTVPRLLTVFFFWPPYLRWAVGVPIRDFVWHSWIRPILGILPFAAVTWLVEVYVHTPSVWIFMAQTAAIVPVAAISMWFVCCSPDERTKLWGLLAPIAKRLRLKPAAVSQALNG